MVYEDLEAHQVDVLKKLLLGLLKHHNDLWIFKWHVPQEADLRSCLRMPRQKRTATEAESCVDAGAAGKLWDGSPWHRPVIEKTRAFTIERSWYSIFAAGHVPEVFHATQRDAFGLRGRLTVCKVELRLLCCNIFTAQKQLEPPIRVAFWKNES